MNYLNHVDYTVMGLYFAALIGLGLYLKRKASESLEDYFIGGRKLPWWALGMSGMASWLDITGTMIIVSFVYMLGPRGLFIEFRGGAGLILPIMLLWVGKWHRRSGCITNAEWMLFRFGDGFGGRFAQITAALGMILTTIGMVSYLTKGVGLFLSTFLPWPPEVCAAGLLIIATIYTMVSGFYGVVFTDIFQSGIILIAVVGVSALAVVKMAGGQDLAVLAEQVTGNDQWMSSTPQLHTYMPKGYEAYKDLLMFATFYLLKGIFQGMGQGGDPKYFGARSDRECGLLSFLWTWMMMFRWPLIMAFAVLGLFLVRDLFPDQAVLTQAMEYIKQFYPEVTKTQWSSLLSRIINTPEAFAPELINGLQGMLGEQWAGKLHLLSYEGNVNPEKIMPVVLLFDIQPGFRGLILIALIAASMSTFDSTVNAATGYIIRDIYQKYLRPAAKTKELIYASWSCVAGIVLVGFLFGLTVENINDIWGWITMSLMGGMLIPSVLRFYWWRFNGSGIAIGTLIGMVGAVIQRIFIPQLDERWQFLILGSVGLAGSIIGTYLTKPTEPHILETFYRQTRPFGFWGPLKHVLNEKARKQMKNEHRHDLLALPFNYAWHITILLLPMQLLIGAYTSFFVTLVICIVGLVGMYAFWYRHLPSARPHESVFIDDNIT